VRTELDSLAALMETHFRYEERRIASALNALNPPGWDHSRPGFLLTADKSTNHDKSTHMKRSRQGFAAPERG
jgi:hypothetical protein